MLDNFQLSSNGVSEGLGSVRARRITGREGDDHTLTALNARRLSASVEQYLRGDAAVEEVVHPRISRPKRVRAFDGILVGEDYRLSSLRQPAKRASSCSIQIGP